VPDLLPRSEIASISSGSISLRSRQLLDNVVNDGRALCSPLLFGHRAIADDVLAQYVLKLLRVTPVLRVAVLQPEDRRSDVRWHVIDILSVHRLLTLSGHEDLDRVVVMAVGTLVIDPLPDITLAVATLPIAFRCRASGREQGLNVSKPAIYGPFLKSIDSGGHENKIGTQTTF
jgi:hypothetical protein